MKSLLRKLILPIILISLLALMVFGVPFIVTRIDYPVVTIDLSTNLTAEAAALVTNRTVTVKAELLRGKASDFDLVAKGHLLDWPYTLNSEIDYSLFAAEVKAHYELVVEGTPWRLSGEAVVTPRTFHASAELKQTTFDQNDPILSAVLSRVPMPGITNLTFSGLLNFTAEAEKTRELPVPVWKAKGHLSEFQAACQVGAATVELTRFRTNFGAEGIANRKTILPMFLRFDQLSCDALALTNAFASLRATETAVLVTEAGAGFCGGEVKLYSLFLNPKRLTTGFTLLLDDIDTNEVFRHLKGFRGKATGRLHGKFPVFLENGQRLRLKDAYLYSTPGETGTLRLENADPILSTLSASGVDVATTDNLAKALADLLYTVLKFDLRRDENGDRALTMKIEGTATHGKTTVPVSFAVTFHGDLESLINTGLRATKR